MGAPVNVLAVMDAAGISLAVYPTSGPKPSEQLRQARAAVAELIKCSDVTVKAFEALGRSNGVIDQLESHRNCERALIEQKTALARATGGAA